MTRPGPAVRRVGAIEARSCKRSSRQAVLSGSRRACGWHVAGSKPPQHLFPDSRCLTSDSGDATPQRSNHRRKLLLWHCAAGSGQHWPHSGVEVIRLANQPARTSHVTTASTAPISVSAAPAPAVAPGRPGRGGGSALTAAHTSARPALSDPAMATGIGEYHRRCRKTSPSSSSNRIVPGQKDRSSARPGCAEVPPPTPRRGSYGIGLNARYAPQRMIGRHEKPVSTEAPGNGGASLNSAPP